MCAKLKTWRCSNWDISRISYYCAKKKTLAVVNIVVTNRAVPYTRSVMLNASKQQRPQKRTDLKQQQWAYPMAINWIKLLSLCSFTIKSVILNIFLRCIFYKQKSCKCLLKWKKLHYMKFFFFFLNLLLSAGCFVDGN